MCPAFEGSTYAENGGYAFCESDVPGANQLTLQQRANLKIVAIGNIERGDRDRLCGKNVRVSYNGVVQGEDYVIWDRCASCGTAKLDFSLDALKGAFIKFNMLRNYTQRLP
jgi:hypothetical protein